jgi:hypothetical protein
MALGAPAASPPMGLFPCCFVLSSFEDMVPTASGAPKLGLFCAGRSAVAGLEGAATFPPLEVAISMFKSPKEGTAAFKLAGILGYWVGD